MNINIREAIKKNFTDSTVDDIRESIVSSINSKDEMILPGLGVFFEILWENSNDETKIDILNIIFNSYKKNN